MTVLKFPQIIVAQRKHSILYFEHILVPFENETAEKLLNDFVKIAVNVIPKFSFWQAVKAFQDLIIQQTVNFEELCRIYNKIQNKVMLIDLIRNCEELVTDVLQIPFVNIVGLSMG